jgi:hypothetical protein
MALFGRSKMSKLETTIAALTKRSEQIAGRRVKAQVALQAAISARQDALLTGDEINDQVLEKLQAGVNSATSLLAGLDDAATTLERQLVEAKAALDAEKEATERKRIGQELEAEIAAIEQRVPEWLQVTRELINRLSGLEHFSFEAHQIGLFLAKTVGECEIGLAFTLPDLRNTAVGIQDGTRPILRKPVEPVVELLPIDPMRSEDTVEVFSTKPFKYRDIHGQKVIVGQWEDHLLPRRLHGRASQKGVVTSVDDPRRKTHRGLLGGELIHNPIDLDSEKLPPDLEQLPPGFPGFTRLPTRADFKILTPGPQR